jgi:hypothetical protein
MMGVLSRPQLQEDREDRAFAELALNLDTTTVDLRDMLHYR